MLDERPAALARRFIHCQGFLSIQSLIGNTISLSWGGAKAETITAMSARSRSR
jgi:hypothetical protein